MRAALVTICMTLVACAHARTPDAYQADTSKLLVTKSDDMKACYDKVLASTPNAAGRVTVKFTVEAKTGRVTNPVLDGAQTTAPEPVRQCVLTAMSDLTLAPADPKTGNATWSWDFAAGKQTP